MPFIDVAFVCDTFDSSECTKDYSKLLNVFFDLDRMEARGSVFFSFLSIRSFFTLFHTWVTLQIPSVGTSELQGG